MGLPVDYFLHSANVLLLVAYCVRDILWLRLFAVAASLVSIPYFFFQSTVLWTPVAWAVCFAGINLFQAGRLYLERQPVKLTPEEEEVRQLVFADIPPRKVLQVLSIGTWTTEDRGKRLLRKGDVPEDMALIVRGKVRLTQPGSDVASLGPGDFVGSALILSGLPADLDATVDEPLRTIRWRVDVLEKYLNANPEVRAAVQKYLARELAGKVHQVVGSPGDQA